MGHRTRLFFASAVLASALPACALAAPDATFDVAPQPLGQALVRFALQAHISASIQPGVSCGPARRLLGSYSLEAGLRRLLAGTGCDFRMVDATTVLIVRAPSPIPAMAPAPPAPSLAAADSASAAPAQPVTVSPLLITSPKRSIGLARAPYAVSAVTGDDLADSGDPDTSGVASHVAGLTVTNLGPGRDKLFVRGLSDGALTGQTQSVVGLYLDDARLTYNAPDPDLRLIDVDRVELLRGPQGTLYGAGSVGGVLQIVTKKPVFNQFSGFLSASATALEGGDPGGVIEGVVNIPLIDDRLAVRAVGYREQLGGYINDAGLGQTNVGGTLREGARISTAWRITDRWQLHSQYVEQTITSDNTHYAETGYGPYGRALSVAEPHRNDFDALTTTLEGDLGWARLKVANALQRHDIHSLFDASASLPLFLPGPEQPATFDEADHTNATVTEATLTSLANSRILWLGGVFLSTSAQARNSVLSRSAGGPDVYGELRRDSINEYAAYGEATWSATDRLRLTVGGRYYQLSVDTASSIRQPVANLTSRFVDGTSYRGFAPKALIEYDFSDTVLLYGESAGGYRAGGFNTAGLVGQVFSPPRAGPQPYRSFDADELVNYEAGARLSLLDGDLKVRLAAFLAQWNNIQADRLLPSGLPFTANVGDGQSDGLELEATWKHRGWSLETDLSLSNPELIHPDPSFPTPADRHLPGVAGVMASTQVRRDWKMRNLNLFWSAQAGYVGKSTLTFDATTAPAMGGYWTSRLSAGAGKGPWRLTGYIDNPLNSHGDTFAYGNPFRIRTTAESTPQAPPSAGVTLTRGF